MELFTWHLMSKDTFTHLDHKDKDRVFDMNNGSSIKDINVFLNTMNNLMAQPDALAMDEARKHLDAIAKPLDGLGTFEHLLVKIAGITGSPRLDLSSKKVLVLCSDNGIVEEGISQSGQDVTKAVAISLSNGTSSVCRMAGAVGASVTPVDMGIACDETPDKVVSKVTTDGLNEDVARSEDDIVNIEDENILLTYSRRGSRNFMKEPAMTDAEVMHAINIGRLLVKEEVSKGTRIIATGEMGIGNTTTSSAVAAMLLGKNAKETAGRGAGLDDAGLKHKIDIINAAIDKYKDEPEFVDFKKDNTSKEKRAAFAFKALATFGGYDIAGMVGIFLGGAIYKVPIVIDGLISATAALVAEYLFPGVREYMIPSHLGKEPAMKEILRELSLEPVICADLALGEGTGAVMLFPLLDQVLSVYNGNTTFDDISVGQYHRF